MKKLFIIVSVLTIAGCVKPFTDDEAIDACHSRYGNTVVDAELDGEEGNAVCYLKDDTTKEVFIIR